MKAGHTMASGPRAYLNRRIALWTIGTVYWVVLAVGLFRIQANGPLLTFAVVWSTAVHVVVIALSRYFEVVMPNIEPIVEYIDVVVHVPPILRAKNGAKRYVLLWCSSETTAKSSHDEGVYLVSACANPGRHVAHVRKATPFIFLERSEMRGTELVCIDWRLLNPPVAV